MFKIINFICLCWLVCVRCVNLVLFCFLMVFINCDIFVLKWVNWKRLLVMSVWSWLWMVFFLWNRVISVVYWFIFFSVLVIWVWMVGFFICCWWWDKILINWLSFLLVFLVLFSFCVFFKVIMSCLNCRVLICSLFIWFIYLRLILISWLSVCLVWFFLLFLIRL